MKNFRVLLLAPGASIWTEPLDLVDATMVVAIHKRLGVVGMVEVNTRSRHRQIERRFTEADVADRGTVELVVGCDCAKCNAAGKTQRKLIGWVKVRKSPLPAYQPGDEPLPTWQEASQPKPPATEADDGEEWDPDDEVIPTPPKLPAAELVTSKEQLAASLAIPTEQIVVMPQPVLGSPSAHAILQKATSALLALLGIPQGKGTP